MSAVIELKNLTKFYGKQRGIEDVSFSVDEGEIFGFIGPNGAGKSTTIRTLLALFEPTGGSATIFGKDCVKSAAEIAQDVGYLPSEVSYYANMKVKELLAYTAALYKKDCTTLINTLCERLSLDQRRKIADLSFGNKKKVGIVAALLHSPRLIILDEPTAGLGPLVQQTFFKILAEENKRGATIFFSSHILGEVQRFCQRVAILKEGKLISIADITELRKSSYKKVSIYSKSAIHPDHFKSGNIAQFTMEGVSASFIYKGDVNALFKELAGIDIVDAYVAEPSLEEIFLHYYE